MSDQPNMKVVKKGDRPANGDSRPDNYIERHEVSLLALLIEKHPERAQIIIARLKKSVKIAA